MKMPRFRRTRKLIDVPAQTRLAIEILMHISVFFSLLLLLIYVSPFAIMFSPLPLSMHQEALETVVSLNWTKWPLFVLLVILVVFFSVLFSHRIVGPHYRLRQILWGYVKRDYRQRLSFRKMDYFHSVIPVVNELRSVVSGDICVIEKEVAMLRQEVIGLSEKISAEKRKKMEDSLDVLSQKMSQYHLEDRVTEEN